MDDPARPVDWRATVVVRSDTDLREELLARNAGEGAMRSVRVTDLLDPRRAYFRSVAEVAPTPERRLRQERGRSLHALLGGALASPRYLEVRVRRDGIVGQVDLLEEDPTELKTTESLPSLERIAEARPEYVDQLAMYCALVGRPTGRLVILRTTDGEPTDAVVLHAQFADVPTLFDEMRRRAARLREAYAEKDARLLPRCAWFDRGCEFQDAGVCPCTGDETPARPLVEGHAPALARDEEWSQLVIERVRSLNRPEEPKTARTFRDLAYPRRAFFEQKYPFPEPTERYTPTSGRRDLFRAMVDLLENGPTGEVTRRVATNGIPPESVSCFRDRPYLVKVTRAYPTSRVTDLVDRQPHYFLELGLRAAAVGASSGRIFLGHERAEGWTERLEVLDVTFDPPGEIIALARDRQERLEEAFRTGEFRNLPACPSWMVDGCPYRDRCACGEASDSAPNR